MCQDEDIFCAPITLLYPQLTIIEIEILFLKPASSFHHIVNDLVAMSTTLDSIQPYPFVSVTS